MTRPRAPFRSSRMVLAPLLLALPATAGAALTHRYSFNDGTADDSVRGANGTLVHSPQIANGRVNLANNGFNYDPPTGQYVDLPNQIARTPAMTLETWVTFRGGNVFQEIASLGTGTAGELQPGAPDPSMGGIRGTEYVAIIAKHAYNTSQNVVAGTIRSDASNLIEEPTLSPSPLPLISEHHIAYTLDFPGRLSVLYIDGQEVARRGIFIDPSVQDQVNNWLGRSQWSVDPFFNGSINEFRIYDNALSPADVAQSFSRGPDAVPEPTCAAVPAPIATAVSTNARRPAAVHATPILIFVDLIRSLL